jgi:CRISPR/Cas system Type II protein with McrA/HNH and RuvC-like nuclease domain
MERVLVLNSDYTPLNVTTMIRGFNLVNKGKAEILKAGDKPILTGEQTFTRPLIIRLLTYIKYRVKNLKVSRSRLYKRDGHKCSYCGSPKNLTIDHVIPKSKGGTNRWTNLITCCGSCNRKKGNKTPEEAGMTLNIIPYEPSLFSEVFHNSIETVWNEFQKTMGFK